MSKIKDKIVQKEIGLKYNFEKLLVFKKPFAILLIMYMIGIWAIIRANFYYIDDMGRSNWGYRSYEPFSRYLSNYLSVFVHGGKHMTDVSPLTQLLAMALIAVAGIIILYTVTKKEQFKFIELIALIPLGLSPYFLECISYKFDCVYMCLSVLAMIFPILFYEKNKILYLIVTILSTIAMCTTYQASSGIFPMFVAFICLQKWINKEKLKEILKFIGISATGYVAGLLIFRKFIMQTYYDYSSTALPAAESFVDIVIRNYKTFFEYIISDFKSEWLLLIGIICIAFIIATVLKSERNKLLTIPISIIILGIMLLLSFGAYAFLDDPMYQPRAMYGFGVFITFAMVQIMTMPRMYLSKTVCIALCWLFVSFAFTYGNALYVQGMYTDFRITEAVDDLKDIDAIKDGEVYLQVNGSIGYAPTIARMPQDFQMLNRLVPITFRGPEYVWGRFGIINYYGLYNVAQNPYTDLSTLNLPMVVDNKYHTIYADDKHVLIELK